MMVSGVILIGIGLIAIDYLPPVFAGPTRLPSGDLIASFGGMLLTAGVLIGKNSLICPKCAVKHLAIGVDSQNCGRCGTPYFQETGSPSPKP
jgi:ribosomal protein S27AE